MSVAFSTTATFGAVLTFFLFGLYPKFMNYLAALFFPTMVMYVLLFFGEGFTLYLYYYGWEAMRRRKGLHLLLGCLLNVFGITLMFRVELLGHLHDDAARWRGRARRWGGAVDAGQQLCLDADQHPPVARERGLWWLDCGRLCRFSFPQCAHGRGARALRLDGLYRQLHRGRGPDSAALRRLLSGREIYSYNEQMGISMMGGIFSWLFIIQAVLIGVLFLSANYYLWLGMERIPGAERYRGWIKFLLLMSDDLFWRVDDPA